MKENLNTPITFYLKAIDQTLKKSLDQALEPYDLTKAQTEILCFLNDSKEDYCIQKDIENYFHISNATVTGLLNRLEAKGLILRLDNPEDRRTKTIQQTPKAIEVHKLVEKTVQQHEQKLLDGFSQEEKAQLISMFTRIHENVSKKGGEK